MRILLYEPIPDINRALFYKRLRSYLRSLGHEVFCLVDERVRCRLNGGQGEFGWVNCSGPMAELVRGNRASTYVYCPEDSELAFAQLERRQKEYCDCLTALTPDRILIWNGLDEFHQDFINVVGELDLHAQLYHLELGWLPQRDHFYCDPSGVNGNSSISQTSYSKLLTPAQKKQLQCALAEIRTGRELTKKSKLVLVPLQIESDTSVQCFSHYKSNQEFMNMLECWIPEGYDVVIRPHPLSIAECPKFSRTDFRVDGKAPLYDSLAEAAFVIGLNSTTLIEALVYDCHVMAFGKGIFSSLKEMSYTEDDSFGSKSLSADEVGGFLYDLLFHRQISSKTMFGIDEHLGIEGMISKRNNMDGVLENFPKYPLPKLMFGLSRFWAGRILKRIGLLS